VVLPTPVDTGGTLDVMGTDNAETIRRWVEEMWNGRRYSLREELLAPRFTEHAHAPFSEHEPGLVDGPQTMRASMEWLVRQFPDLSMTIEALVAHGDLTAMLQIGAVGSPGPGAGRAPEADEVRRRRACTGR
jgi:SnoaL-like polyketide cyclase